MNRLSLALIGIAASTVATGAMANMVIQLGPTCENDKIKLTNAEVSYSDTNTQNPQDPTLKSAGTPVSDNGRVVIQHAAQKTGAKTSYLRSKRGP